MNNKIDINLIWNALEFYREKGIPQGNPEYDLEWQDIECTMNELIDGYRYKGITE